METRKCCSLLRGTEQQKSYSKVPWPDGRNRGKIHTKWANGAPEQLKFETNCLDIKSRNRGITITGSFPIKARSVEAQNKRYPILLASILFPSHSFLFLSFWYVGFYPLIISNFFSFFFKTFSFISFSFLCFIRMPAPTFTFTSFEIEGRVLRTLFHIGFCHTSIYSTYLSFYLTGAGDNR